MGADLASRLHALVAGDRAADMLSAAAILVFSAFGARLLGRWVRAVVATHGDTQRALLVGRLVSWGIFSLGLATALDELGFQLRVLLGAAGVISVAVGFASQTTLSNLISGFFLFGERPFKVGDIIEIDSVSGEVLSIDMMATTLRTMDNRFVRIPNELVIKTKMTNHTRFPIRRLELTIPMRPTDDLDRVREIVLRAIDQNPLCLVEPPPSVHVAGYTDVVVQVRIWVWTRTKNLVELQVALANAVQRGLGEQRPANPV
jgi:small-conductance mechanosensitive channel